MMCLMSVGASKIQWMGCSEWADINLDGFEQPSCFTAALQRVVARVGVRARARAALSGQSSCVAAGGAVVQTRPVE